MRYVVIGAGAVGGAAGALLHAAGHEVVLTARGAHLAALRERGLTLVTPAGTTTHAVPAAAGPGEVPLRPGDVLLLAVKTQDTTAALEAWADRPVDGGGTAGDRLPLVCLQNGTENERLALRRFARVYGACVVLPATLTAPGTVAAPCAPLTGVMVLGRAGGPDAGADPFARELAEVFTAAGLYTRAEERITAWKYAKLVNNLPNAVEALLCPGDEDLARDLAGRVTAEADAVLAAAGIERVGDAELAALRAGRAAPQPLEGLRLGTSTWQSLERGAGSVETDYLNGEIVLLSRLHGVPAPVNAAVQRAARRFAREGLPPRGLPATALAEDAAAAVPDA